MFSEELKKNLDEREEFRELKEVESMSIPDEVYLAMAELRNILVQLGFKTSSWPD